jgi:phosphotransferase system HPr-like phosphotransfer protein
MLAAGHGSIIKISATGSDAMVAVSSLVKLVEEDAEFNEI